MNQSEHIGVGWAKAQAAAAWTGDPERWRRELAEALRVATGASFAAVYTCPPDQPLEAHGAVAPESHRPVMEGIVRVMLPKVERTEDSTDVWSKRVRGMAYAPLEQTDELKLVERARELFLRPAGLSGFLVSFLLGSDGQVLGYILVAGDRTGSAMLRDWGAELGLVATIAGGTLQAALLLAAACGARVPAPAPERRALSTRERDVVRLVSEGLSDLQIAQRLEISEQTVGSHLRRIYTKLGVHSRAELLTRFGPR